MAHLPWLQADDPFPAISRADSGGLLAAGSDLSPERLLDAYQHGIFPWFSEGDPILWWSPAPRCVIYPEQFHASRSLLKHIHRSSWRVTANKSFADVMRACATVGDRKLGTWITDDMFDAYCEMHHLGWAHSLEVWQEQQLVGGIYGLAIGKIFYGESMFSRSTNASKTALFYLCRILHSMDFKLLDCQVENPHLLSLGADNIPRETFQNLLEQYSQPPVKLARDTLQASLQTIFETSLSKHRSHD